jgi:hypothetical protein
LVICCYALECWQFVVMYWNVGNLLLCTGMLAICCYVLECWQFVVIYWNIGNLLLYTGMLANFFMYWNVGNLLLCTGMLTICCYVLECWQFNDKTPKHKQKLYCRFNLCNNVYQLGFRRN